ncbi:hypothetical protein JCGZ_23404 [Jatropha curcas]|uniref:Uncharacterized protein n=1 Tax=Jatropha curcas TaxID=180498 RepID=A0A067JHZ7_JATCU|nr:hypothetical protein JCGZ_23404 [Jatropha curcas]
MAKKKLTHSSQHPKQVNPQDQNPTFTMTRQQSSKEDPEEKLQNLKSLNGMLLKETIERRQQVESLKQAKEGLESELARTGMEKTDLENELARASEERVCLEIEKGLFSVFIKTRMNEMGVGVNGLVREQGEKESEIRLLKTQVNGLLVNLENEREKSSQACRERDLLRIDLDNWEKEANGLKRKVTEMEKNGLRTEEEIKKLNLNHAQLTKQNKETEEEIKEVKNSRDLAEKKLLQNVEQFEDLKREIEEIVKKKNEVEMEKSKQKVKISELEKHISELNEIISSLRGEEGVLREKVLELEKCCGEAIDKGKVLQMEINALGEEKKVKERTIKRLMGEIDSSGEHIKALNSENNDKEQLIERLIRDKNEIEDLKVSKESEIVELHGELSGLKDVVFTMQESLKCQEDENKQLASEVGHYRDAFEKVRLERDNAHEDLDEEKRNGINLRSKVLEMEKRIEETLKEFAKMKTEHENLFGEKKELECQVDLLKKEKDLVQKKLLEAKQEIGELKTKMESSGIRSERALALLKNTAALVRQYNNGKGEVSFTEKKIEDEIEPYATQLEVIKNSFRNKETAVEEMKQQVKFLQISVADANKKKGLWALVSSAATVLVAASVAYVATIR